MYQQDTDYSVMLALLAHLDNRLVIDVGAERGSFVDACLATGSAHVYACEPYAPHVEALQQRFATDPRVTTLACAIGARDETAQLHIARDRDGKPYDYHHSLVPSQDSSEVRWDEGVPVPCRSLSSLIADGTIPQHVGLLKIDTEGGDLGVLQGLGPLGCGVIVVEYWEGLPHSIGDSPYRIDDVIALLQPRGYGEFVFIKRHDELEVMQWNATRTRAGDWGNLVFVHREQRERLLPVLAAQAAAVHERLVDRALAFRVEATKRNELLDASQKRVISLRAECDKLTEALRASDQRAQELDAEGHKRSIALKESHARAEMLEAEAAKRLDVIEAMQARSEALQARIDAFDSETARLASPETSPAPWIGPARDGEADRLRSGRPRVSIVTPSFNHGRFLEATLRSVLDQGYPDLEYIVIDGGSTDDTVDIIRRYADRLAYWVSERDRGQADALNKGFSRATGDIVAWLNSDDVMLPGAIDAAVAAFAEDPARGLVYGRGHRIDEHGGLISEFEETRPFDLHALEHGVDYILQPTTFMRHQALHEVGPLDNTLNYAFDWDLWLRLGKAHPAVMLDRVLAASREYASTKTSSGGFRRTEEIRRLAEQHTGATMSVGYLNYLMNTILEALPSSSLPETARLSRAVAGVTGVCHELLREQRFVEYGPAPRPRTDGVQPYRDGWAGPELRWHIDVPREARYLCLRGAHDGGIAHLTGTLNIHARVDGQPLGFGVVDAPGPFALCWRLPASAVADADVVRRFVEIVTATSFVASRFHDTTDHRTLAFLFTSCTVETSPPPDAMLVDDQVQDVLAEVRRRLTPAAPALAAVPSMSAPMPAAARGARRILGGLRRRAQRLLHGPS